MTYTQHPFEGKCKSCTSRKRNGKGDTKKVSSAKAWPKQGGGDEEKYKVVLENVAKEWSDENLDTAGIPLCFTMSLGSDIFFRLQV